MHKPPMDIRVFFSCTDCGTLTGPFQRVPQALQMDIKEGAKYTCLHCERTFVVTVTKSHN